MATFKDSVDKIIQTYFSSVTLDPFVYKKIEYKPKNLRISPGIFFRRMHCVEKCGACCFRFSLDYLETELIDSPEDFKTSLSKREIIFNDKPVTILSDVQETGGSFCKHVIPENGRCRIHGHHPFSCDFELLRFAEFPEDHANLLNHRPFGRGWNMTRVTDGGKGALCDWYETPCTDDWKKEIIRKFNRLKQWTDHFGIKTTIPSIINWIERGPHQNFLVVGPYKKQGFGYAPKNLSE